MTAVEIVDATAADVDAAMESAVDVYVIDVSESGSEWTRIGKQFRAEFHDVPLAEDVGIAPPHDPARLLDMAGSSSLLRPCVDAYATNIDGFGLTYRPLVDLDDDAGAARAVAEALEFEAWESGEELEISPELVAAEIASLRVRQSRERLLLDKFVRGCARPSLIDLRRRTRADLEHTGNGYWEIARDDRGRPRRFTYIPAQQVRIHRPDGGTADEVVFQRSSVLRIEQVVETRSFLRYTQRTGGQVVWYREFGDPRVMSAATGRYYTSAAAMRDAEVGARPATEIHHFKIHDPTSVYGSPRWIGAVLSVMGSRAADEVNLDYFHSKPPAGMLLVNGGKLNAKVKESIEQQWQAFARGKDRFHGLVIVEAVEGGRALPSQASGKTEIKFMPLTETQTGDALFQRYDERNADKVGAMFRIPRLLRGNTQDFNRATSESAMLVAEQQVFAPERSAWDDWFNSAITPLLGVTCWDVVSRGPDPVDLERARVAAEVAEKTGALEIGEVRRIIADSLNADLTLHFDPGLVVGASKET